MTREQKQLLRGISVFLGVKALIYASIYYSAKHYRESLAESNR
jgi:hypothetical protein